MPRYFNSPREGFLFFFFRASSARHRWSFRFFFWQQMKVSKNDIRRISRNALFAAGIRVAIGLLKSLAKRGITVHLWSSLLSEIFSLDPMKWSAFVAGLSSVRNFENILRTYLPQGIATAAAGVLAASPVLVFQRKTQTELLLYFLARVVHHVAANLVLPKLPEAMQQFSHYDVLTVMASSAEILYSFLFLPKCHSPSYQGFLLRATMTDRHVLAATAASHRQTPCPEALEVAAKRQILFDPKIPDTGKVCELYHRNMSCSTASAWFVAKHFAKISLPLYLPLKAISTVVFHGSKVAKDPIREAQKVVLSAAKSAAFLTAYCATSMRLICAFAQLGIRNDVAISVAAGVISGTTTIIEDKPRRLDLAIYCLMQAIRSSTLLLYHKGYCGIPRRSTQVLLYLGCVAYLFATFSRNPSGTHPTVAKMFSILSGEDSKRSKPIQ